MHSATVRDIPPLTPRAYAAGMTDGFGGALRTTSITLYTDEFTVKGKLETPQRRVTDALNGSTEGYIVLAEATFDEHRSATSLLSAEFAQINLASVLFVVSDEDIGADPALVSPRHAEEALISVPPFRVTGRIHVLPERSLREALGELRGQFIPVTEATYWSDSLGEGRMTAALVAVNHARCQILAPHHEVDPWAGLGMGVAAPPETPAPPPGGEPTGW